MTIRLHHVALLLLAAGAAGARPADDVSLAPPPAAAPAKPLADVLRDLDAILLAGGSLPDFLPDLMPLPPAERLLVVAYARRAGLLTGPALPLAELLGGRP